MCITAGAGDTDASCAFGRPASVRWRTQGGVPAVAKTAADDMPAAAPQCVRKRTDCGVCGHYHLPALASMASEAMLVRGDPDRIGTSLLSIARAGCV